MFVVFVVVMVLKESDCVMMRGIDGRLRRHYIHFLKLKGKLFHGLGFRSDPLL